MCAWGKGEREMSGWQYTSFLAAGLWMTAQGAWAQAPAQANPFPENTDNVPVMPTTIPAPIAEKSDAAPLTHAKFTVGNGDPVRSPDDEAEETITDSSSDGFSSSRKGLDKILPDNDEDVTPRKRHGRETEVPQHTETAAEDVEVGGYYLEKKNWKAALSRFQSALVLDPENPEVFWGLAEAERNLGKMAEARAYYLKLLDYDPKGPHGKAANKALKEPSIANAPSATPAGTESNVK